MVLLAVTNYGTDIRFLKKDEALFMDELHHECGIAAIYHLESPTHRGWPRRPARSKSRG